MLKLKELIDYWKERQSPYPALTSIKWDDVLVSTIHYLKQLNRIKEVSK